VDSRFLRNSLLFSLLAGNFAAETGSQLTASSATQLGLESAHEAGAEGARRHLRPAPLSSPNVKHGNTGRYRRLSIGRSRTDGAFARCQGDHKPI